MVQKVFGLCAVPSGTNADEPLQARKEEHKSWDMLNRILLGKERGAGQRRSGDGGGRREEKSHKEGL